MAIMLTGTAAANNASVTVHTLATLMLATDTGDLRIADGTNTWSNTPATHKVAPLQSPAFTGTATGLNSVRRAILTEAGFGGLPIAAFLMQETSGTSAVDLMTSVAGTSFTGTYTSSPTLASDNLIANQSATSVRFNAGSYLSIAHNASLNPTGDSTLMFMMKMASTGGSNWVVMEKGSNGLYYTQTTNSTASGGGNRIAIGMDFAGSGPRVISAADVCDGNPHLIHCVYINSTKTLNLYVDGVFSATNTGVGGAPSNASNWNIGSRAGSFGITGNISHWSLFNYAMAANRIRLMALYFKDGMV